MPEVKVPFRLRSGGYAEVGLTVEDESPLTEEDLLAALRSELNGFDGIEADLNRRESMKHE